jgi:nitrite reductase (cytochrome c-552)
LKGKISLIVIGLFVLFGVILFARATVTKPSDAVTLAKIPEGENDPAVWGKHYPLQYRGYQKNLEMTPSPTGFGGSVKFQHSTKQPEILMNFKGMAFSKDYSEDRGHLFALEDLKESKRLTPASPGACMTCKTANLVDIYKDMGWKYASTPIMELFPRLKHTITCANCHDPSTMNLRVVNPAFIEAMQRRGIDVTKANREALRSYVCGQCHAEYYFEPGTTKVVFPWDKGFHPEQIYAYYQDKPSGFAQDWMHPESNAPMLKAQHPDFETWSNGTHARANVSCADCHMPFMREEGKKYSSHWVTSPMKHVKESCGGCHEQTPDWFLERVKATQGNIWQLQRIAGTTVAKAHEAIGRAQTAKKVNEADLIRARELVRKAQWYWDMVAAENSMGFHNPVQCANVLGQSIDLAHQAAATAGKAAGGGL